MKHLVIIAALALAACAATGVPHANASDAANDQANAAATACAKVGRDCPDTL